jgi:hypothetical protein
MVNFSEILNDGKEMVIATGCKGKVAKNVLLNVMGQLSDGMWENSRTMEHYWPFANIEADDEDNVYIVIHKPGSKNTYRENNNYVNLFVSPWKALKGDHTSIKQWFADKIKKIVAEERKDEPGRSLKFKADNDTTLNYMSSYDKEDNYRAMTVAEAYSVYKVLKG